MIKDLIEKINAARQRLKISRNIGKENNIECLQKIKIIKHPYSSFKTNNIFNLKDQDRLCVLLHKFYNEIVHIHTQVYRHKVNLYDFLYYDIETFENNNIQYKITRQKQFGIDIQSVNVLSYNDDEEAFYKSLASHLSANPLYEKISVYDYQMKSFVIDNICRINVIVYSNARIPDIEILYNESEHTIDSLLSYFIENFNIDLADFTISNETTTKLLK